MEFNFMYTKKDFANELIDEVNKNFNIVRISRWAHEKYLDHGSNLDNETYAVMMKVIAMEEGEEFELSKDELLELAKDLILNA